MCLKCHTVDIALALTVDEVVAEDKLWGVSGLLA